MMSLSVPTVLIALCSFPLRFSFWSLAELRIELTPSLSCCAISSSRWEAVTSVAAMKYSVRIFLEVPVYFNPRARTSSVKALLLSCILV